MRVGNLGGKGRVYELVKVGEFQGYEEWSSEILLNPGERLLGTLHGQRILFHGGWSNWFPDPRFPSADGEGIVFYDNDGAGSLHITDSRIVFLRRPDLEEVRRSHRGQNGYSKVPPLFAAQAIVNADALEYCEIMYTDVVRYEEKKNGLRSYLLVDGKRYRLVISKEAGDLVLPIYKKKIWES
jgi:hypothetical protein